MKSEALSRRELLLGAGKVAAGAAILSLGAGAGIKSAEAYEYASAYKYAKLDPKEVGDIAYKNYFKRWCTSTVITGFVEPLKKKVGGAWKNFPIDAYRWGHGGLAGWGTVCGTLPGAGIIIGMVTRDTDVAEAMVNDLAFYYSYTELPSYVPPKIMKSEIHQMTMAGTPLCHVSVGKWMSSEGVGFLTEERAERCARLSANVAIETAQMLNDWVEGKYKPKHRPLFNLVANGITSQNNCMDCHGQNVPAPGEEYEVLKK